MRLERMVRRNHTQRLLAATLAAVVVALATAATAVAEPA
jgi:hypothetical protein